jgi:hypothetical protein
MRSRRGAGSAPGLVLLLAASLLAPPSGAHPRPNVHKHARALETLIVLGAGSPARRARAERHGVLDLNVKPKATVVWVDGRRHGPCSRFDGSPGKLRLPAGFHDLRLVLPDGHAVERQVRVRPGVEHNVTLDLR